MSKHKISFWKIAVILFVFFFVTASGNIDSIDATTHLYLAKQIALKGRIDFGKDELAQKMVAKENQQTGNYYPIYNFGYALLLTPAVLLSSIIRSLLHAAPSLFPAQPDWIMTWYFNLFNGVIVILIAYMVKRLTKLFSGKKLPENIDLFVLLGIFSSNLIVQGHQQFVHLLFTLFALVAFELLVSYIRTKKVKYLYSFSLTFAFIAASYNSSFLFLIPAFTVFYLLLSNFKEIKISTLLRFSFVYIPAFVIQFSWNYLRFGNPVLTGYHGRTESIYVFDFSEILKHLYGMTLGPNKGLIIYSPILIFSFLFCIKSIRSRSNLIRSFILFFLTMTVSYLLFYSPVTFWHGDSAYGPRYLTPLVGFGLIAFVLFTTKVQMLVTKFFIIAVVVLGIGIQIPGLLIPHFTYRFISKTGCVNSDRWYYDPRCTPFLIGWAQLLKRETKETPLVFRKGLSREIVTDKYPNPLRSFRTIYPDPLFDKFSSFKTSRYKVSEDLYNCIYAFTIDLWWVKQQYYRNISLFQ